MKEIKTQVFLGDCKGILKDFKNDCIDLIFTSPPYADRQKHTYGEIKPEEYVECFLERSEQFLRVLKLGSNRNHSAVFPESLPEWFIKLFTEEGDTVLDPFMGSGTTLRVAKRLRRNSIGIDIVPEYCETVKSELRKSDYLLF